MSDATLAILVGVTMSAIGGAWQVLTYFLDREERARTQTYATMQAKDAENHDLREENQELREENEELRARLRDREWERDRWTRSHR